MKAQMNWRFHAAILWIAFYLILLIVQGCKIERKLPHDGFVTVVHEECEYVLYLSGGVVRGMAHAGNCSNHIEQPCKEIRYR